jgi:hypothetical protein
MPLDWAKHPTDLADAHEAPYGGPPWPAEATVRSEPTDPRPDSSDRPLRGRPIVVPAGERAVAWLQLYTGHGEFVFAAGPRTSVPDANAVLTHLATAGDDAVGEHEDETGVQPAGSTAEPVIGGPPREAAGPMSDRPAGLPYAGPQPDDRMLAGPLAGNRPPAAQSPDAGYHPQESAEDEQRPQGGGGMLHKATRAIRSLGKSLVEGPPEHRPDVPSAESTTSAAPPSGPAKDLDYWRRAAQAPPESHPHKPAPPDKDH